MDIRSGTHQVYSRVVLQFDSPVKYLVVRDSSTSSITIDILSLDASAEYGPVNLDPSDPFIRHIQFSELAGFISITLDLHHWDLRAMQYVLRAPFRIVVDLWPGRRPQTWSPGDSVTPPAALEKTPEIADETPAPNAPSATNTPPVTAVETLVPVVAANDTTLNQPQSDSSAFSEQGVVPESVRRHTQTVDAMIQRAVARGKAAAHAAPAKAPGPKVRKAKINMFWVIGITFVLLDAMLLVLYIRNRATKKKVKRAPKRKARPKPKRKAADPVLAKAPASHRPARKQEVGKSDRQLSPKDFSQLLSAAIDSNQLQIGGSLPAANPNELAELEQAVKLDELIGSISGAINDSPAAAPAPPQFAEIANDLKLAEPEAELTEQTAREQLIGRDGVEFMRNIKRLYLN